MTERTACGMNIVFAQLQHTTNIMSPLATHHSVMLGLHKAMMCMEAPYHTTLMLFVLYSGKCTCMHGYMRMLTTA